MLVRILSDVTVHVGEAISFSGLLRVQRKLADITRTKCSPCWSLRIPIPCTVGALILKPFRQCSSKLHLLTGLCKITVVYLPRKRWVKPRVSTGLDAAFLVSTKRWLRTTC